MNTHEAFQQANLLIQDKSKPLVEQLVEAYSRYLSHIDENEVPSPLVLSFHWLIRPLGSLAESWKNSETDVMASETRTYEVIHLAQGVIFLDEAYQQLMSSGPTPYKPLVEY